MKLLLIQLSDIHVKNENDPILLRNKKIYEAIRNLDYEVEGCVIIISGDIAYSGKEEQYIAAIDFISSLEKQCSEYWKGVDIKIVALPGNHDCDFTGTHEARDILVNTITKNKHSKADPASIEVCTEVQEKFFEFRDALTPTTELTGTKLFYEYTFQIGDGLILIRCCNTAWLSQIPEQQGSLYFPTDAIVKNAGNFQIALSVFHHPYNWLDANNAREFRKVIESNSDIILTGHEHDMSSRYQRGALGEENLYIEADALKDTDTDKSGFNVILIETDSQRQKLYHYRWNGNIYQPDEAIAEWQEYHVNRIRKAGAFVVRKDMMLFLDDLGLGLTHPVRGNLKLSDVFVYPDLVEVKYDPKSVAHTIHGEGILDRLRKEKRILISGSDYCGRTAFSKRLFVELHKIGLIPILINAGTISLHDNEKLYDQLEKIFITQYEEKELEQYRQLNRSNRALIIDDYHKLSLKKSSLKNVLYRLSAFSD